MCALSHSTRTFLFLELMNGFFAGRFICRPACCRRLQMVRRDGWLTQVEDMSLATSEAVRRGYSFEARTML